MVLGAEPCEEVWGRSVEGIGQRIPLARFTCAIVRPVNAEVNKRHGKFPRSGPSSSALLAEGIYIDFPAELRLRPDGETLTPYPPLTGQWFIWGHGKRPQSDPKSVTQLI